MAINFKETKEIAPWDKFAAEVYGEDTGTLDEKIADVAKSYHEWLERKNPEVGACILCERRFKPRNAPRDDK